MECPTAVAVCPLTITSAAVPTLLLRHLQPADLTPVLLLAADALAQH
jgi:hypothetical protein